MTDDELRDLYIKCMVAIDKTIPSDTSRVDIIKIYSKIISDLSHDLQIHTGFLK